MRVRGEELAYNINGNMMCGVHKDSLIVRLGEAQAADALGRPPK